MAKYNPITSKPYSAQYYSLLEHRRMLPIFPYKSRIMQKIISTQITFIRSEAGSGKTTQIPQWCLEWCFSASKNQSGMYYSSSFHSRFPSNPDTISFFLVIVVQPRRLAVTTIANRVSSELDVVLGDEVGYCVRFDNCCSAKTLLYFKTDGLLLREAISDASFSRYGVIIIDEAHTRTIALDIILGLLKKAINIRKDLRIVIMSASHIGNLEKFFDSSSFINIPGRSYPVDIIYSPSPVSDYIEKAIELVIRIHNNEKDGDILLFMTGQEVV